MPMTIMRGIRHKHNKNRNIVVIEINEKLFKDKRLTLSNVQQKKDEFIKRDVQLNMELAAASLMMTC